MAASRITVFAIPSISRQRIFITLQMQLSVNMGDERAVPLKTVGDSQLQLTARPSERELPAARAAICMHSHTMLNSPADRNRQVYFAIRSTSA